MPVPVASVRAWLQPIIRGAARVKYPWTRLYEELKLVAPVYRKAEFGYDYRSFSDAYDKGDRLKFVRRDYKPSSALFSEARVGMRKTFKYNVESRFVDRETGAVSTTRSSFVSSDRQLTRREIEDIVSERVSDIAEDYDAVVETTLTEAWHREGDFWD